MINAVPFVVLGLPRTRSFWLAQFLSQPNRPCAHDPARFFTSRHDIVRFFDRPGAAAVDTVLGRLWGEMAPHLPADTRVVVVHRALHDVVASMEKVCEPHPAVLADLPVYEQTLGRIHGKHVPYEDMSTKRGMARLFEYCTRQPFDAARWRALKDIRLECDHEAYRADIMANLDGLKNMFQPVREDA